MKISTLCTLIACIALLICAAPASAAFLMNGSGDPTVAPNNFVVDQGGTAPGFTFDSDDGTAGSAPGFLHQDAAGGNYQTSSSPGLDESAGFFVEAQYEVVSNSGGDDLYGSLLWVQGAWGRYLLGLGEQGQGITINGTTHAYDSGTGPFHKIRVQCDAGCGTPSVILDGNDLGTFALGGAGDKVGFGDHSAETAEVIWDYVVVNQAIPEPTSGLLLAMGLLGLAACGRRRKQA